MKNHAHVIAARAFAIFVADHGDATEIGFSAVGPYAAIVTAFGADGEPVAWRIDHDPARPTAVDVSGYIGVDGTDVSYPAAIPVDATDDVIRAFFRENLWPGETD